MSDDLPDFDDLEFPGKDQAQDPFQEDVSDEAPAFAEGDAVPSFPADEDEPELPEPGDDPAFVEDEPMPDLPEAEAEAEAEPAAVEDDAMPVMPDDDAPDFSTMSEFPDAMPTEPSDGPDFGALADSQDEATFEGLVDPAMAGISDDAVEDPLDLQADQIDPDAEEVEEDALEAEEEEGVPGVFTFFTLLSIHGLIGLSGIGGTGYLGYMLYKQNDSGALSGLMWVTGTGLFICLIMAIIGALVTRAILKDHGKRVATAWSEMGIYGALMLFALFSLLCGTAFFGYELYRYDFDVGAENARLSNPVAVEYLCDLDDFQDHWNAA